jgi:uncharacterized membrane protein
MALTGTHRLAYLDWLRGMACIGMFEVHAYDSWLTPAGRQTNFFGLSQFSGTLPAPLFISLAGLATALMTDRMRRKGASPNQIATRIIRRGAEIYCLGFLFRLQEFVLGWPHAPRTDLLRVDVLNMIGLSVILLGILCRLSSSRKINGITAAVVALSISLAAPLVWTTWRPQWLPWYLESYFDGVHVYGKPQSWLFPLFPWSAFAFAGLAVGFILTSDWSAKNTGRTISIFAAAGTGIFLLSWGLNSLPVHLYPVYDYWHTSPNFFLARFGTILVVVWLGFAWCQWGLGAVGFSPLIQLGQTSLLVYWVHNELVYGRFSIMDKHAQSISMATVGVLVIIAMMLALSIIRIYFKGRVGEILAELWHSPRVAAEG